MGIILAVGVAGYLGFSWLMFRLRVLDTGPEALFAGAVLAFIFMASTLQYLGVTPS